MGLAHAPKPDEMCTMLPLVLARKWGITAREM
jgi:hypothetical protein